MGTIRGVDAKIYLNTETVDPYANEEWTFWETNKEATLNMDFTEADATCRGGGGFKASAPTLTAIEVTGTALKDKSDPVFVAMELAARTKATIDVLVLDGPLASADTDGVRMQAIFTSWNETQTLEDVVNIEFTMKPGRSEHVPEFVSGPIT